ncbi:SPX domain-containing protein [Colletotrichum tofieldiae]|nr:SPX domain-containing protein [Colletotrichum tofieldiae]
MKYGEQLEQESVPEWSLHNVDYNSLKHEIKVHTSRDQATAIAIPATKMPPSSDSRTISTTSSASSTTGSTCSCPAKRTRFHGDSLQKLIVKCAEEGDRVSLKRHRRFAKYERDLLRCGEETLALARFINAQITAFRKITKKYKKWTGSPTLGARFRENVLANPKSFTRRDLNNLQTRYEELLNTLRTSSPQLSEPSSPSSDELDPEGQRLLGNAPFLESYGGISPLGTDTDDEYASSDGMPTTGYATHFATFPSVNEQQVRRYRERVLFWGTVGCFGVSFLLLLVAGILISTGRHKLRAEVDAGVTVGVVASLFSACLALGMSLYRRDDLGVWQRVAVYSSFFAACVLNGMLLILVVGNAA